MSDNVDVTKFNVTYSVKKNTYVCSDFKASTLEQVHQEILHLSKREIGYKIEDNKKINFSYTGPEGCGVVELWGLRKTQEDISVGDWLNEKSAHFSLEQWKSLLIKTFAEVEEHIKQLPDQIGDLQGACFCGNVIIGNTVITANLGDSETFLVSPSNLRNRALTLNTLHKATNDKEIDRIEKVGGKVFFGRVSGELAIARAFGDNIYNRRLDVVSHIPEIIITSISPEDTHLVIACDGLREGLKENAENIIASTIQTLSRKQKSTEEIAITLALTSLNHGSTDNISVIVIPIKKITRETQKKPIFYYVVDGHGGAFVADKIYQCFIPILEKNIAESQ